MAVLILLHAVEIQATKLVMDDSDDDIIIKPYIRNTYKVMHH